MNTTYLIKGLKNLIVISVIGALFAFCSNKRVEAPKSQGFQREYACVGLLPVENDTSFSPTEELLTGYLNIELFQKGYEELFSPKDFVRLFREEGKVSFPTRFGKPSASLYSELLGLDGAIFGRISSDDKLAGDITGKKKNIRISFYFLDTASSRVIWSYVRSEMLHPGDYNADYKRISKDLVTSLKKAGFRYDTEKMPCWDTQLAQNLRKLPDITREMFNILSLELEESGEENLSMNLGNIFMTLGKRDLALQSYKRYLAENPASPFRDEVERQVAILAP